MIAYSKVIKMFFYLILEASLFYLLCLDLNHLRLIFIYGMRHGSEFILFCMDIRLRWDPPFIAKSMCSLLQCHPFHAPGIYPLPALTCLSSALLGLLTLSHLCLSFAVPMPRHHNYSSFLTFCHVWWWSPPSLLLFFKAAWLSRPSQIRGGRQAFSESACQFQQRKSILDSYWDCVESIAQFGDNCHPHNFKALNPRRRHSLLFMYNFNFSILFYFWHRDLLYFSRYLSF